MEQILKCKHCSPQPTTPTVRYWGAHMEIFCKSPDFNCYPGAWVEGTDHAQVIKDWNFLHGHQEKVPDD